MSKYVSEGGVGKIVSLTQGEAGQIRDVRSASRRNLGSVRQQELAAAARVLGVSDTQCHDIKDGTLAGQPEELMIDVAKSVIDDFVPDVVISFGPDGAYGHPDHVAVSRIATLAATLSDSKPAMLHAVFPRSSKLLVRLLTDWLEGLDGRFMGTGEFAHGLMLFADGSSMLGYAADHLAVRFYPPGTFIIEQGEPSGELFLVLSGVVDIQRENEDGSFTHVAQTGTGSFVGEDGIASGQPRNAHVVANTSVTCFVLSPGPANNSAGRGDSSEVDPFRSSAVPTADELPPGCIAVDVTPFAEQKVRALACHRTQYAIEADMFPPSLAIGLFGVEYFTLAD